VRKEGHNLLQHVITEKEGKMRTKKLCLLTAVVLAFCLVASVSFAGEKAKGLRLFNGKNLNGWKLRNPDGRQSWSVVDGVLCNETSPGKPGTDLVTVKKFGDCFLHIEFKVPKGGNSGVYLQGLYEIQVADSFERGLSRGMCGAIYGKAVPSVNACKPAGEWQSFDITFRQARLNKAGDITEKARITVVQNGKKIIDDKEMDGKTGGALPGKEGTPGALMLQGNHSSVQYRNIVIRPAGPRLKIRKPRKLQLLKPVRPKVRQPKPVLLKPALPKLKPVRKIVVPEAPKPVEGK